MNIQIRHAVTEDYRAIHHVYSAPSTYSGTLQLPYVDPQVWRKRLENATDNNCTLVACVDDVIVGSIGLHIAPQLRRRHVGIIGMGVHDKWQKKGIGKELLYAAIDLADNWYGLRRLELSVFVDNARAISLYKNAGFLIEGTLRQYAYRAGAFIDAYSMARIKSMNTTNPSGEV